MWNLKVFLAISILFFVNSSCSKKDKPAPPVSVPVVITLDPSNISTSGATFEGKVGSDGGSPETGRGFCWSTTNATPTVADNKLLVTGASSTYSAIVNRLVANTDYYIRAFASNQAGTGYGEVKKIRTIALNANSSELKVAGNKILNASGVAVRLTGVNCGSLEYNPSGENIMQAVQVAFDDWNSFVVRLPLNQHYWFGYGGANQASYRNLVTSLVEVASKRNKYIILELHWSGLGEWGKNIAQHRMPDDHSIDFWTSVTSLFKNNPAVLFGLFNEPYEVFWDVWKNGGSVTDKGITYHAPGMQPLVQTVRDAGAKNICIVGGLEWGYDLRGIANGYALTDRNTAGDFTGNGIVYDAHVYPWKNNRGAAVTVIANSYPILIGECGYLDRGGNEPYQTWTPGLLDWMDQNKYHWTGWCLNPNNGPTLIRDWNFNPTTEWGIYAKNRLLTYSGLY
jgi:endoglucanase